MSIKRILVPFPGSASHTGQIETALSAAKAPSPLYSPPRILAPKPMSIGIGREFALVNQVRAISSSVSRLR
jgi:hypothetical protein